jgi:hypothetical protein
MPTSSDPAQQATSTPDATGSGDPAAATSAAATSSGGGQQASALHDSGTSMGQEGRQQGNQDVQQDVPSNCICPAGASDRDCLIAIIDKVMGSAGQYKSVSVLGLDPDYSKLANSPTSCGDVLQALLRKWGNGAPPAFGVDDPIKPDGQTMPQRGDIFVLKSKTNGQRAHVGIFYEVNGSSWSELQWRSAEGGQGPMSAQTMWISDGMRGPDGQKTTLEGWKSLDDFTRDRAQCKKNNKR